MHRPVRTVAWTQLGRDRVLAAGQILDPESIINSDQTPEPTVSRDPEASPTPGT